MVKYFFKKILFVFILIALFVLSGFVGAVTGKVIFQLRYFSNLPVYELPADAQKKETCALCPHIETNPPVLVDLNTGEVVELKLYDRSIRAENQISPKRHYGTMHMGGWSGGSYAAFPDNACAHISIRKKSLFQYSPEAARLYFCENCLAEIEAQNPTSNYIFADCYNEDCLRFYHLKGIEKVSIRHYSVEINQMDRYLYCLTMNSSYFCGGKALDGERNTGLKPPDR